MLLRIKQALANIPITARVTLWYSFFIIVIVAALVAISAVVADEVFEDVSQKKLAKSVTKIANDMDEFEPYDDGIFFIKYNAKGDVIGGLAPKHFQISLNMNSGAVRLFENGENRFYYYDIAARGKGVWVRGVINAEKFFKKEGLFLLALGVFVPVLFIFVLYGGYKTIKNAMKPVATMSKTALEIGSSRDFSKRIDLPAGKDELHALASVFNQMLDSLEKVYQSEKQLTSDVSHELRTPLSVIMAESDYAASYAQNLGEAKESLEVISRQSRKITSLIDQILELSRLEVGRNLQLKRILTLPEWEAEKGFYNTYAKETGEVIEISAGRCNLVPSYGRDREVMVFYQESMMFSVVKSGYDDDGKITFSGINGTIEGDTEITGKVGSRAEAICMNGKIYITVHNKV